MRANCDTSINRTDEHQIKFTWVLEEWSEFWFHHLLKFSDLIAVVNKNDGVHELLHIHRCEHIDRISIHLNAYMITYNAEDIERKSKTQQLKRNKQI